MTCVSDAHLRCPPLKRGAFTQECSYSIPPVKAVSVPPTQAPCHPGSSMHPIFIH